MILEFLILALPIYIIFTKLKPSQKDIQPKFSNILNQEEAIEYRCFLEGLADYLNGNNQYISLFFKNPILFEYIQYYINDKRGKFVSLLDGHNKSAYEEFKIMEQCYGEELFNKNEIMDFYDLVRNCSLLYI